MKMQRTLAASLCLVLGLMVQPTPAPVPRCSPIIGLNKVLENNNWSSDANPYFPVPPCEYGGWYNALRAGDYEAVSVLARPEKIPLHNFYEFFWFWKTGVPRAIDMATGKDVYIENPYITNEGYKSHAGGKVRVNQLGQKTYRNPEIIDNPALYKKVIFQKLLGPKPYPHRYTYQKNLKFNKHGRPIYHDSPFGGRHFASGNGAALYNKGHLKAGYAPKYAPGRYGHPQLHHKSGKRVVVKKGRKRNVKPEDALAEAADPSLVVPEIQKFTPDEAIEEEEE